jgi:iron complex outermembrane receptor protein
MKRPGLFRIFLVLALVFFSCSVYAQETGEAENDFENWEIMEGQGLTVEAEAPPREKTNPAQPERSGLGAKKNVVSGEQIERQGSEDFSDALRNVPGVIAGQKNLAGTTTGASLYVRGRGYSHPATEVAAYFDGVPRYGLIYGQSMADGIPLSAANSIEVYKSPQPSEFGAGYALVNVEPRYMDKQGWALEGGFSGGSYFTFLENAAFGLRKGRFDIFAAQSWMSSKGHVVHSGARQQSYYLNAGLWINAYWELRLLGNYVDAETEQAPHAGQSRDDILSSYHTNSAFTTATLKNEYDNARGFLKLYFNDTQFRWLDEEPRIPGDWSLQSLRAFGAKAREEWTVLERGSLVAGMDLDWMLMTNEDHNTSRPSVTTAFPAMILFSPYAGASWLFGDKEKWHITPSAGIRGYVHSLWANQLAGQGGLALGWKALGLNFNYARGLVFPAPAIIQSLLGDSALYGVADLKDIEPEKIDHFEGGISVTPKAGKRFSYTLDAAYFFDSGRDRIVVNATVPRNASSISWFTLQGLELAGSVDCYPEKLFANAIELFVGSTWYTDLNAAGEDGNRAKKMPFTPVFSLSAGFRWVFLEQFHLAGDLQFLHDFYTGGLGQSPSFTEPSEENKLKDICLLNLRLGFSLKKEAWRLDDSELFVSLNNVFNYQYEYYTGYIMPGITFMLGARLKFKDK